MTQQGSSLQNYNAELVNCIEQLREKREELNRSVAADEEEKAKIQNDLRILTERLARINDNLARKITSRNEYDKTITEVCGRPAHRARRPEDAAQAHPQMLSTCLRSHVCWVADRGSVQQDHGELADSPACAEARVGQPHEEKAGLRRRVGIPLREVTTRGTRKRRRWGGSGNARVYACASRGERPRRSSPPICWRHV